MIRRSLIVLAVVAYSLADDPPAPVDLNARVADFARSKVGEKVGDGICSTLIQEALRDAGAKVLICPAEGGEYLWGEPLKSLKDARAGDILQFEKVTFRGRRRIVGRNGAPAILISQQTFPHHSAIITKVGPKGRTLTIHHQNAAGPDGNPVQIVQETTLLMSEMQKGGSLKAYRPVGAE